MADLQHGLILTDMRLQNHTAYQQILGCGMFSKKIVIHGEAFVIDGRLLGSGSQGEVFKITHTVTGVVYAVKIVRVENGAAREAMAHEISILKLISSPYIISILPFSITSDRFSYMIMDFCESGDLKDHYRMLNSNGGVKEHHIKKLIYDCTQGYKELEKHKILHMDIKLENILLKAGNYALSDFGLAINMNSNHRQYGGSMLYLSPSRFITGNPVSPADDMFAFGIVVCEFANKLVHPYYAREVLKGAARKECENVMEYLYKQLMKTKPVFPSDLSPGLTALMERMLDRRESSRIRWNELEEEVDHDQLFADVREAVSSRNVHLLMPILEQEKIRNEYMAVRQSHVQVNLLNSKWTMEAPKAVEAVYTKVREILRCKLEVCRFLARVFDVIQVYHTKDSSNMFVDIQSSMLSIMEQLIDLDSISQVKIPGLESAPECIEIQIERIQQQFDQTLAVKNKVKLMRQYCKLEELCKGFTAELSYELMNFQTKVASMLKRIEGAANMKEIHEDGSVKTSLFKLVLYLLHQVHSVMEQGDCYSQMKLIPQLGHYDLEQRDYANKELAQAVGQYLANDGKFVIYLTENDGCHEIFDDDDELQPPEPILLNRLGNYPPLY